MSTPTNASGDVPRLTSNSTLARPALRAARSIGNEIGDGLLWCDLLAVHPDDHVALLQAGTCGRTARNDRADDLAAVLRKTKAWREILVERLQAHAEIAARGPLPAHQ